MAGSKRMLRVASVLVVAKLLLGTAHLGLAAELQTLEGTISDRSCGISHKVGKIKHNKRDLSDVDCTKLCILARFKYALVVNDVVYELEGKTTALDELAGQKAKVTGIVDNRKIQVESAIKAP